MSHHDIMKPDEVGQAIVPVLACVLNQLCARNDRNGQLPHKGVSKFHALRPPQISIKDYLQRILKYAACSVMLAAKFFDDQYFNNAYYAKVGGVPCGEINSLEVEFLFMTNFTLFVNTDTYTQYYTELCNHANNPHNTCNCAAQKVPPLIIPYLDSTGMMGAQGLGTMITMPEFDKPFPEDSMATEMTHSHHQQHSTHSSSGLSRQQPQKQQYSQFTSSSSSSSHAFAAQTDYQQGAAAASSTSSTSISSSSSSSRGHSSTGGRGNNLVHPQPVYGFPGGASHSSSGYHDHHVNYRSSPVFIISDSSSISSSSSSRRRKKNDFILPMDQAKYGSMGTSPPVGVM